MKKLIVANWKMYLTLRESVAFARRLAQKSEIRNPKSEIVVCPSFVALEEVGKVVKHTRAKLGAQDVEPQRRGAYTGEVGLDDLREIGVEYVLVGHSERRKYFNETDEMVNKKLRAVLKAGMQPILCVGESLSVRKQGMGKVRKYVGAQVRRGLRGVSRKDLKRVVVAYEPIWAIGSGRPDTPEDASSMHRWIREVIDQIFGGRTSGRTKVRPHVVPILYGGSVNSTNAKEFLSAADIDGLLIGKASTQAASLRKILNSNF